MELISTQLEKIEDMLSRLDEIIDVAKNVPFSGKISIEKNAVFDVIDDIRGTIHDMRKGLPSEMNQAKRVMHDRDTIVSEAKHRAEMMIKAAETEVNKLLNEHDITYQAKENAQRIEDEAREHAKESLVSAGNYIIDYFDDASELLEKTLEEHLAKARELENFYNNILTDFQEARSSVRVDRR
ncbi:MAG: hypothetical protein FWB74_10135 [Defluviitaleaceae bacterium]|nr:hypothetical protein [Defluviitaleaceae bacterium]